MLPLVFTIILVHKLINLLEAVCHSDVCKGNFEEKFTSLPTIRDGVLMNQSSKLLFGKLSIILCSMLIGTEVVGTLDSSRSGTPSVYHAKCEVLVSSTQERCSYCAKHRKCLTAMASRASHASQKDDRTNPSSHTNYVCLKNDEKDECLRRSHHENRMCKQRLRRLQDAIAQSAATEGIDLDEELHDDFLQLVKDHTNDVHQSHEEGTFQRLFWTQQHAANSVKNNKSIRWHPLIIKWCLYLRHLSNKSYELLRNSGCIKLPSQRTLRDYTHYIKSQIGFSSEIDRALVDAADLSKDHNKYVVLVMDEMFIKSDLVYDKHDGSLIGFINISNINNQLLEFEAMIDKGDSQPSLASSMMLFMVKGLLHKFDYPYAQFACGSMSGDLMFDPVWEAVSRLERIGFFVLGLCCDGASSNRKLWKLHSVSNELLYKIPNVYASDGKRFLYFISDPPHLLKTIRNSWYNPVRKLWVSFCYINISTMYACTNIISLLFANNFF